jgi:DNA-binding MarR family transcriptional regulator
MTPMEAEPEQGKPGDREGGRRLVLNEIARDCLGVRVRLLNRTMTRIYDAALRPHGLTAAQLNLLASIESLEPARAGELANLLSLEISTLSRNAHLMERAGWVTIERAERGNGRVLRLTKAGARKLEEATPAWRQAQKEARSLLGNDEASLIRDLVDGIWAKQISNN